MPEGSPRVGGRIYGMAVGEKEIIAVHKFVVHKLVYSYNKWSESLAFYSLNRIFNLRF